MAFVAQKPRPVSSAWLRYGSLGLLVAQDTALVLLLRHSRSRSDGPGPYVASCAVATMECCKLLTCFCVLFWICRFDVAKFRVTLRREVLRPREVAKLSVPALLYLIQNNLLYYALGHLRATPYKVVYNLKILTGAFFSRTLLRQDLGPRKWLSLMALFMGVVVVQTAPHESASDSTSEDPSKSAAETPTLTVGQTLGFAAVFLAAVTSGFCGVYQQRILQGSGDSMWARNIQMGVPSVVIGLLSVALKDGPQVWRDGPFKNFDHVVFGVIFLQALGGLNVAFILKYADNILKGFAAAFSTVASCLLEMALFGFRPSTNFLLGGTLITVAAYYYNYKPFGGGASAALLLHKKRTPKTAPLSDDDDDDDDDIRDDDELISPHHQENKSNNDHDDDDDSASDAAEHTQQKKQASKKNGRQHQDISSRGVYRPSKTRVV